MSARERATPRRGLADASILRVRAAVAAGLDALVRARAQVNALDADGDTGDNMVATLRAALEELDRLAGIADRTIDEIGREEIVASVARAALLGARGRAGVILSQLVRGAAEELAGRPGELVDPVLIGAALSRAADQAYGSVRDPAEGTMLTVVREMARRVASELAGHDEPRLAPDATALEQDLVIARVIHSALRPGSAPAPSGPDQLRALCDAGVIDAGGYGIIVLVGGIADALSGGRPTAGGGLPSGPGADRPAPPSS